jgi:hypothetical protein
MRSFRFIKINVNLAACLLGVAAILDVLFRS